MAEIVVADAGPLIALGRLRKLELLAGVFEKVIVPPAVLDEMQYRADLADAQAIFAARQSGLLVVDGSPGEPAILPSDANLGVGEAAAICLAAALGHGVLMDEKLGRAVAEKLKLSVIGTVGVLLIARRRGLIPAVKPLLEELRASGHHLSTALIQEALHQAGE